MALWTDNCVINSGIWNNAGYVECFVASTILVLDPESLLVVKMEYFCSVVSGFTKCCGVVLVEKDDITSSTQYGYGFNQSMCPGSQSCLIALKQHEQINTWTERLPQARM